eukprot:1191757-Prorocentrum_minimum.AAC.3
MFRTKRRSGRVRGAGGHVHHGRHPRAAAGRTAGAAACAGAAVRGGGGVPRHLPHRNRARHGLLHLLPGGERLYPAAVLVASRAVVWPTVRAIVRVGAADCVR